MANRYTNLTPSAYTPLTLEEIAMVPAMKRKQHDAVLAQQEAIRSGLAKVDPLDVHFDKALQLKQGIESKMDATAQELSEQGISNDMIGKTIGLNREYQDLVSPTGQIGQINAAKVAEAATKKEFMDSPELKEYSLDAKQKAWDKHRAAYTGYDDKGKITNIGALSGPKYEDMQKDFMDLSGRLGEVTRTKLKNLGAHFEQGPFGGLIMKTGEGKVISTNNDPNLKALADTMAAKYIAPTGEGYKSREFAGYNLKNTLDQLNGMMGIPVVDKEIADMNYGNQFISPPSDGTDKTKPEKPTSAIFDPDSTQTLADKFKNVDVNQIGSINQNNFPIDPKDTAYNQNFMRKQNAKRGTVNTYKDIFEDRLSQKAYETAVARLKANKRLPANAGMNDKETARLAGIYMRKHMPSLTIGNDILRADSPDSPQLFMSELDHKPQSEKNAELMLTVKGGKRDMIDINSKQKVDLAEGETIEYEGFDAPTNYNNYGFGNSKEQSVMPHRAIILDSKGNLVRKVAIARTKQEMETPEYNRAYEINQVYKNAINNFGTWVTATGKRTGNKNLRGTQVRYNDNGTIDVRKGDYKETGLNPGQYMQTLENIMTIDDE